MYYVPDSILFVSAVNSGFEIVRIAMMPDSTVYINRIDKLVMVLREENSGNKPPINFFDLEYMMNKIKLCGGKQDIKPVDNYYVIDRSLKDIGKKIYFSSTDMKVQKFEFFNKKSGEYIVGECLPTGGFTIYSNYLVEDLTIKANGGILKYNENHDINMGFNKRKYEIVNL
jgi:hypothetical protein